MHAVDIYDSFSTSPPWICKYFKGWARAGSPKLKGRVAFEQPTSLPSSQFPLNSVHTVYSNIYRLYYVVMHLCMFPLPCCDGTLPS